MDSMSEDKDETKKVVLPVSLLRDYFAGQVLGMGHSLAIDNPDDRRTVAEHCYLMADAMLEARNK